MNNKKILVVDDDQDILDIISYLLIGRGYLVKTLPTRDAVIKTIKKFHHDQLLMDVMLAGMDGREICKDIKGLAKLNSLPVILISGTHNLAQRFSGKTV
jgi:DNA-binding response OmpR family regulator